jgi:hypothetical protein
MTEKHITIKEVNLNNNCPECFNQDLRLTFKQKFVETLFYKSITNDIGHQITCNICHTIIYPVNWTDDLERVFDYHKKVFVPKKSSARLKKAAWIAIIILTVIIITTVFTIVFL